MHCIQDHGIYLGLPSFIRKQRKRAFDFIKDRLWSRLQIWKHQSLSGASKEVLIKTVAQALPNHAMNIFLFPQGVC